MRLYSLYRHGLAVVAADLIKKLRPKYSKFILTFLLNYILNPIENLPSSKHMSIESNSVDGDE